MLEGTLECPLQLLHFIGEKDLASYAKTHDLACNSSVWIGGLSIDISMHDLVF